LIKNSFETTKLYTILRSINQSIRNTHDILQQNVHSRTCGVTGSTQEADVSGYPYTRDNFLKQSLMQDIHCKINKYQKTHTKHNKHATNQKHVYNLSSIITFNIFEVKLKPIFGSTKKRSGSIFLLHFRRLTRDLEYRN